MRRLGRAPLMIGAAVALPLFMFIALQLAFSARDQRDEVRADTLATTEHIIVEADGKLQRTLGALDVLATARSVSERDWRALHWRLQQHRRIDPSWVTVILTDLATREVIFDLRQPFGANATGEGFVVPPVPAGPPHAFVGGMGGGGPGCPCALAYRFYYRDGAPAYLLAAAIDPMPFYRILASQTEPGRVAALVDREGNIVARSLDHRHRVGTPATIHVRNAIRQGRSGTYSGRTWEGFRNYTAFSTSPLTGWSAHVAFSTSLLDSPRWRSLAAAGLAAIASLALAFILVWFTLRQLAEARAVQERLQEAQKMEALGQITGGIAHDFNNLLTPIVGGLGVVARRAKLDASAQGLIESALSSAQRAAKLTAQLLAFSRRQRMEIGPVDLAALLAELKPLLEQSAGPDSRVGIEIEDDARCVESDANQLELALLNLVLNSRDAMPRGGTVLIRARAAPPRRGRARMVTIEVSDDGQGMAPDVLRRATEPFFTTKPAGSGTGLGLSQVYGIVEQSGGSVSLASEAGHGSVVTLTLPACELPTPASPGPVSGAVVAPEGRPRIVLCDDDDEVRTFVARVLDASGYVVEAVSDGRTAIEVIRNAEAGLLVVDFAMHGMNGAEVIRAAHAIHPALPVLIITGYSDTEEIDAIGDDIPVLRKPFEANVLLEAVQRALAGSGSGE